MEVEEKTWFDGKDSPITPSVDWPIVQLRDIALKIGSGATPKGGAEAYLPVRSRYALVRSQNVFDRHFDEEGLVFISDEQAERLKGVVLQPNDILLNITGDGITFGRACVVPPSVLPACVSQHVSIVRVDPRVADPGYVLSFLTHAAVKSYIESFNAGGSRRAITKGHIESFRMPLPPLSQQRSIAHVLDTIDDKIEQLRCMNRTLEEAARAIFQSWFVDFAPVRSNAAGRKPSGMDVEIAKLFSRDFTDSELGPMPKRWRVGSVADLADDVRDVLDPADMSGHEAYVGLEHIPRRSLWIDAWGAASSVHSAKLVFRKNDILFGKLRPYFHKVALVNFSGVCSTDVIVARPKKLEYRALTALCMSDDAFVAHASANADGTRMPRTRWSDLCRHQIVIPCDPVAAAFERCVEPYLARALMNIEHARDLATLRDTLLPKLLSGVLRVPDTERFLAKEAGI